MKNKEMKLINGKLLLVIVGLIFLASLIFIVSALTSDERASLQGELDNLTAELSNQGYSWLVNIFFLQLNDKVYNNQKLLYSNSELT